MTPYANCVSFMGKVEQTHQRNAPMVVLPCLNKSTYALVSALDFSCLPTCGVRVGSTGCSGTIIVVLCLQ